MDKSFWLERWEANEIGFHQDQINTHLQRYWPEMAVPAGASVFVPLCGKTRDMLWLAAQGYRVIGVEISALAVRAFFEENNLDAGQEADGAFDVWSCEEITILCGDYFDLTPTHLGNVGAVFDRASLIALPEAMRRDYARHHQSLLPRSPVLLITLEYPESEMPGPPFAVEREEVEALYAAAFDIRLLETLDVLAEYPRFQARGLSRLEERVYRLAPR